MAKQAERYQCKEEKEGKNCDIWEGKVISREGKERVWKEGKGRKIGKEEGEKQERKDRNKGRSVAEVNIEVKAE